MCTHCRNPLHLSRRGLIAGGFAALAAGAVPRGAFAQAALAAPPNAIAPDEALRRIMDGNARYVAGSLATHNYAAGPRGARGRAIPHRLGPELRRLAGGAGARLRPEPGQPLRGAGCRKLRERRRLASLEYGARFLGVPLIMVLGHFHCGAVSAGIKVVKENLELPGHLPALVGAIRPAVEAAMKRSPADLLQEATAENVRLNVRRLAEANPILSDLVRQEKVKVVGAVYDIGSGKVSLV
jgi:carbonic anhydrase